MNDREAAEMAPLIAKVKNAAILGTAVEGTTLVISADSEKWSELDDSTEAEFKSAALAGWVKTWKHDHPGGHATLRVMIRNYYGQEITSASKRV